MRSLAASLVVVSLSACAGPTHPPMPSAPSSPAPAEDVSSVEEDAPPVATNPDAPACASAQGWRYERIDLPPEFAPSLPAGVETLWFAPGMFDPSAPDYFTYAFSLDWSGEGPKDLTPLLAAYFRGLMTAVAAARESEPELLATVIVAEDGRTAEVVMSDEFTQTAKITVQLRIAGDSGCTRVWATADPTEANWAALAGADACLCP